jgi:hypothetical protein
MKYLLAIYSNEVEWGGLSDADRQAMYAEYAELSEDLGRRGMMIDGAELRPTSAATTVRVRDGRSLVTDGPFAETKEALGGYYLSEAPDLDHALDIAKLCPARFGGVEVRPIMDFSGG